MFVLDWVYLFFASSCCRNPQIPKFFFSTVWLYACSMMLYFVIVSIKITEIAVFLDYVDGGSYVKLYVVGIPRTGTEQEVSCVIYDSYSCFGWFSRWPMNKLSHFFFFFYGSLSSFMLVKKFPLTQWILIAAFMLDSLLVWGIWEHCGDCFAQG